MEDEVDVPDHCWKEKRRNDARKWVLNYGENFRVVNPTSTMKQSYTEPQKIETHGAKRRELFRMQALKEISEEIRREQAAPSPVEEYCTTYDTQFQIPGFHLDEEVQVDPELSARYPLYRDTALSVWQHKLEMRNDGLSKVVGVPGRIVDPGKSFARSTFFSRPLSERLDDEFKS